MLTIKIKNSCYYFKVFEVRWNNNNNNNNNYTSILNCHQLDLSALSKPTGLTVRDTSKHLFVVDMDRG
jgi:hypothetical protein